MEAAKFYLGEKQQHICRVFAQEGLYGAGIAYTITAAASVRAILRSNCYHQGGHNAPCQYEDSFYMLVFGVVEILLSQIPDFHSIGWLSIIAAAMSFSYAFIGSGLGFLKVIENGTIEGSITGVPASSNLEKLWLAFEALADIAFAYPYTLIVLEIQDTLESPPPENQTMKAASLKAIVITTFVYLCCGCFGYAAFGDSTPGNLLTGFGFYEPYWLVDLGNACIVLHLVGAYQVFSQPVFGTAERWFAHRFPHSGFLKNCISFRIPLFGTFKLNPFRAVFRTAYVVSTTVIAMAFPYFNSVLGVLGALNFWPLAVYFPVEMTFSCLCFLVTVVGFVGSLAELIGASLDEKSM
ncbi:Aa_trans domain-containing protein [Psidium guajava]|nr:Aa_trans domain-containing protein [Psidium guajava]